MKKIYLSLLVMFLAATSFAQWTEQATGFATASRGIQYIHAVDANTVWATAYNGTSTSTYITEFTKTTNGGTTWTAKTITGYTSNYGSAMIFGIDGNTAWMPVFNSSAGGGKILKTTDGGNTWAPQTTATFAAPSGFPNVIHFWDANNGFCMGDPNGGYFEIYTTTNGGTNWVRTPTGNIPAPSASDEYGTTGFYSTFGNTVWFSTNKGRVFKSTDMGLNWTVVTTPLTSACKILFKDANNGILYQTSNGLVCETSDGGATWTLFTPTGNLYTSDIAYVPGTPNTYVTTAGSSANASYSLYGGHIWTDFVGVPGQVLATAWVNNSCGWAGSFNTSATVGGMYKFTGTIADPFNNDIGVLNAALPVNGIVLSSTEHVQLNIMNYGLVAQSNFNVSYSINGGATVTELVTASIAPGATYTYTFTQAEDFSVAATYTISATTALAGDENTSNDAFSNEFFLMTWVPQKVVFGEEGTGTWCQWCVRGHVYMGLMATNHPTNWIGVAVHNADPMVDSEYDAEIGARISGYPSGLVDRVDGEKDPTDFEAAFNVRSTKVVPLGLSISNVVYNTSSRLLSYDVVADCAAALNGDYRFNAIISEDGVTGTTSDYNQANAYAGGAYGVMGGYETKPNPVPAAQMVYDHVGRALLGGWDGTIGSVPATVAMGTLLTQSYSITLDPSWDETKINMIGLFINNATGEVINATKQQLILSINDNNLSLESVVYPNPSNGVINIRNAQNTNIEITNILGDVVTSFNNTNPLISVNLSDQPQGMYFVKISDGNKSTTKKILITK